MTTFLSDYKRFPVGLPIAGTIADPDSQGYVYIIGFEEPGIVKIGSALSVGLRLMDLQAGNPFELHVRATVSIYNMAPALVEFAAHRIATKMGTHIRGEWFSLSDDDALRCVIDAAKSKRARYGAYAKALDREERAQAAIRDGYAAERKEVLRTKLGID